MIYAAPGAAGAKHVYKAQYNNFIGGQWVAPVKGQYFDVITPVNGQVYTQAARSTAEDIELALDAAHAAADAWGKTDAATRSNILLKIADRIEANLELLAYAETVDNGKAIRETLNADIPLTVDHFRYFAGCVRAQEGALSNIDENTVAYHIQEPLGVVGQIIPWNFPILMAAWKLAPAIGAANNLIPATLELGGKSPNIFFADVMDKDDGFLDKAIEGMVLFAFNQGEVCTCPSRALIQESIYDKFMERVLARVAAIKQLNPLDTDSMMGAQASKEQLTKILSYLDLGKQEGAEVLAGGAQAQMGGDLDGGYYVQPTLFKGHNKMRIFQEEIFWPRAGRDHLQGRSRSAGNCQRHAVRPGRWRVEPQQQRGLPHGPRHQGRPRVDQLLPRLPRARCVRWLQRVRHWPRNPQDDAGPLPTDQKPAGQLQRKQAGLLLKPAGVEATPCHCRKGGPNADRNRGGQPPFF